MSSKLKRLVSSFVPPAFSGTNLLDYLCQRYSYQSRSSWQELISSGDIRLNGVKPSAQTILKSNDQVDYDYTPSDEPAVDINYTVLFEDDSLMIIDKPGDLPMHPSGKFFNNTLWALLKTDGKPVHIVNRLDRETSGLVVIAKNPSAAKKLAQQFEQRQVEKEYYLIVEGHFPQETVVAQGYLEKDENSSVRKKQRFVKAENYVDYGKTGVHTELRRVKLTGQCSHLKVTIHTGKMHQIRATVYSLGFPIVGDKIYGVDETFFEKFINKTLSANDQAQLRMERQALHAQRLVLKHPVTGEKLSFVSPLPKDMQEL